MGLCALLLLVSQLSLQVHPQLRHRDHPDLSIATKLVFYPLTQSSLRAMKLMHHLQPQVKAIQEKHKSDPQKMNKAMMDLYKEYKVNPVSGLPADSSSRCRSSSRSTTCF